jgi:hypothetical protein
LNRHLKNLLEIVSTASDLLEFRYPGFVYGMESRSIPVFCLHQAESIPFESMLSFLDSNGYRTIDSDEYVSILCGIKPCPEKAVVLTFDDGWGSLWTIGFPLLKRYGMKAVVFIPPGRIGMSKNRWSNLDDLDDGRCRPEDVVGRDRSSQPLLTWEEIAEMHGSGLVDFQSHSHSHALIRVETKIVDFVNPRLIAGFNMLEFPRSSPGTFDDRASIRLGEPLYRTASRLSDARALIGGERVSDACVDFVERQGGEEFFQRPDWRNELAVLARSTARDEPEKWSMETLEEQRMAIRFELSASKRTIEDRLPGKQVHHICYPWHVAGRVTVEEAKRAGYSGCFCGKVRGRYFTEIPGDPVSIARIGGDFFFRLPGEGRSTLSRILTDKMARRAKEGSPYLTH